MPLQSPFIYKSKITKKIGGSKSSAFFLFSKILGAIKKGIFVLE
ncbi:hypothetical protein HMPREF0496_1122 [Lentilactobacillus hilgardii ATCC 27305]|nr:hypothetical protein HMPREF0496_1122 [Lentilactobacillus hilgardii ATCC 27305]